MKANFKMTGALRLEKVLKALPKKLRERDGLSAVRAGATVVRKSIQAEAPVSGFDHGKYGPLKKNIKATRVAERQTRTSITVTVHTGKAYWGMFSEFGTYKMPAQPFFAPGLDAAATPALQRITVRLSSGMAKTAKELAGRYGSMRKSTKRRL